MKCSKRWLGVTALTCMVALVATPTAEAQSRSPPNASGPYTAYVVMTPNGPATCATWVQWRGPGANATDKEGIQYWAEGYISGLAAGSHHNILGNFRLQDLGAWLDRYCAANPQTKLPLPFMPWGVKCSLIRGENPNAKVKCYRDRQAHASRIHACIGAFRGRLCHGPSWAPRRGLYTCVRHPGCGGRWRVAVQPTG